MNLYVMRHGKTNFNEQRLCNDDPSVDVHLNKTGLQQAQSAAEQLRDAKLQRIIVSPLPRTRQTAEVVNQFHHAPIEVHPDISDIRTGFDGQPVADYFAAIAHNPLNARPPGGESQIDHKQRIMRFIQWLITQNQDSILIVAHEETLRIFIAHFEGNVADEQLRDLHIANCEFRHYTI